MTDGYVIAVWEDADWAVTVEDDYANWVGWMPFVEEDEGYADDATAPPYTNLYATMGRYLGYGRITEILEYHPHGRPDFDGPNRIGARCTWWSQQLRLRDKEHNHG